MLKKFMCFFRPLDFGLHHEPVAPGQNNSYDSSILKRAHGKAVYYVQDRETDIEREKGK